MRLTRFAVMRPDPTLYLFLSCFNFFSAIVLFRACPFFSLIPLLFQLQNVELVEEWVTSLFNGVFVHRFRDSNDLIRADTLERFGYWVELDAGKFVQSK